MKERLTISRQFMRFAIVGIVTNSLLYTLYILSTLQGIGHKSAMTTLFALGTILTFAFNRKWTFQHNGKISRSFIKYTSCYCLAYFLNLTLLIILSDRMHLPHQAVQAVAIILNAILLFLIQRYWVFEDKRFIP